VLVEEALFEAAELLPPVVPADTELVEVAPAEIELPGVPVVLQVLWPVRTVKVADSSENPVLSLISRKAVTPAVRLTIHVKLVPFCSPKLTIGGAPTPGSTLTK